MHRSTKHLHAFRLACSLVFAFGALGCASTGRPVAGADPFRGGGGGGDRDDRSTQTRIVVDHNGRTGSDIEVYLLLSGISRRRLGRVTPGEAREFSVTLGGVSSIRLVGEIVGESDLFSRTVQIRDGQRVRWNIALNQIEFVREEALPVP